MSVLEIQEFLFVETILGEGIKGMLKLNINEIMRYLGKILPPQPQWLSGILQRLRK